MMYNLGLLLFILVCVCSAQQPQCTFSTSSNYDDTGDLLILYSIPDSATCCANSAAFEECAYFAWDSANQQCTVKSSASSLVSRAAASITAGSTGLNYNRETVCSTSAGNLYNYSNPLKVISSANSDACCSACADYTGCNYWTFSNNVCKLQPSMGAITPKSGTTSGTVVPQLNVPTKPGKRGLGIYGTQSCSDLKLLGNVSWVYNWSPQPGPLEECMDELGLEFIPMVWGLTTLLTDLYTKSEYLLTFNEPNFSNQANMSPAQAVAAWPAIEAFADKYAMKISSPSASYGGQNGDPIDWLDSFFTLCVGCRVDFITTHQYDCTAVNLYGAITNFKKYGLPIWVTEFSCYGSSYSQMLSFAETIVPLFESDSGIERYSWFGCRDDGIYNIFDPSSNALTPHGQYYTGTAVTPLPNTSSSGYSTSAHLTSSTTSRPSSSGFPIITNGSPVSHICWVAHSMMIFACVLAYLL